MVRKDCSEGDTSRRSASQAGGDSNMVRKGKGKKADATRRVCVDYTEEAGATGRR